jgi:hypothetical protein
VKRLRRRTSGEKTPTPTSWSARVAENPQQTVRELRDLVVTYAKQETVDPLKGLGRYVGFGIGGAMLLGLGLTFLALGGLRALQTETGTTFHGNWSWAPYAIIVATLVALAGIAWVSRGKRKAKE